MLIKKRGFFRLMKITSKGIISTPFLFLLYCNYYIIVVIYKRLNIIF